MYTYTIDVFARHAHNNAFRCRSFDKIDTFFSLNNLRPYFAVCPRVSIYSLSRNAHVTFTLNIVSAQTRIFYYYIHLYKFKKKNVLSIIFYAFVFKSVKNFQYVFLRMSVILQILQLKKKKEKTIKTCITQVISPSIH